MITRLPRRSITGIAVILVAAVAGAPRASAGSYSVAYAFTGNSDGAAPYAGVVKDNDGNLYGENSSGGNLCGAVRPNAGCGAVYKISPSGQETTLVTFAGSNGAYGIAPLTLVGTTLYGETFYGGSSNFGVIFSVHTDGSDFTILHQFSGADGIYPVGGLQPGPGGVLYGVSQYGGPAYTGIGVYSGYGVLFQINQDGTYVHLHDFADGTDNAYPQNILIDSSGTIFGAAGLSTEAKCYKGANNCGVIYQYFPSSNAFSVLYTFKASSHNDEPQPLLGSIGSDRTLYGVTFRGGSHNDGTLFSLPKSGPTFGFKTLWNFGVGVGGLTPLGGPVIAPSGAIVGVTQTGAQSDLGGIYDFQNGTMRSLYSFSTSFSASGDEPHGALLLDRTSGSIFGVGTGGGLIPCTGSGSGCGVVYRFKP